MQKLEKLFESLDAKVFTTDLKESLQLAFNEAVEIKSDAIAAERIEEEIDALSEKSEAHIDFLSEKAEEYAEMKQEEMVDSVDKYLDRVVEEFTQEAKESLDESLKSEKADMIIEAFDSMLTATGVEVASIVEAKDNTSVEKELEESTQKYDVLIDENIELKEQNEALIKMGVIFELKEGLTLVESEKFSKLAELVEFSKDASYAEKLETIKESVKGSEEQTKQTKQTKQTQQRATGNESVYAHLI